MEGHSTQFFSPYAPLTSNGPLPPGLRAQTVTESYRFLSFKPKKLLHLLHIRNFSDSAGIRLRRELDKPAARHKLSTALKKGSFDPLHGVLYRYLRAAQFSSNVYNRIIRPAEIVGSGSKIFLDPGKLNHSVSVELAQSKDSLSSCAPNTDGEALALFALRGGSGNSDSVVSGSLASRKPPGGGGPKERGNETHETESRSDL